MRRSTVTASCAALAVLVAGCGSGERQDANEPSGSFDVEVSADFPEKQRLARQEQLVVDVRNTGTEAIPNVAVTLEPGFSVRSNRQDLADPNRPVWILDDGPVGGGTAYTNTWALGNLPAGESRQFVWKVTPVRSGSFEVGYRVSAGLDGKARAVSDGDEPRGEFNVRVSGKPAQARVDPETGEVIRDGDTVDAPEPTASGGSDPAESTAP